MKAPVLEVERVSASYTQSRDFLVLEDVTTRVEPGTTLAVVGELGSGKSTLARVITGLCRRSPARSASRARRSRARSRTAARTSCASCR